MSYDDYHESTTICSNDSMLQLNCQNTSVIPYQTPLPPTYPHVMSKNISTMEMLNEN